MCFFFLIWSPLLIHLFMKKSWVGIHGVTHGSKLIKRENKNTWKPFSVYQVLLWLPHLCTQHFHSYTNLQVVHTKWGTAQSEENINDHAVFSKQNTFWGKLVVLQNCSHRASRYVVSLSYFEMRNTEVSVSLGTEAKNLGLAQSTHVDNSWSLWRVSPLHMCSAGWCRQKASPSSLVRH